MSQFASEQIQTRVNMIMLTKVKLLPSTPQFAHHIVSPLMPEDYEKLRITPEPNFMTDEAPNEMGFSNEHDYVSSLRIRYSLFLMLK